MEWFQYMDSFRFEDTAFAEGPLSLIPKLTPFVYVSRSSSRGWRRAHRGPADGAGGARGAGHALPPRAHPAVVQRRPLLLSVSAVGRHVARNRIRRPPQGHGAGTSGPLLRLAAGETRFCFFLQRKTHLESRSNAE